MLPTPHRERKRRVGLMLLSRRSRSRGEQQSWPSGMGQAQMPANPTRKTEVQAYSFEIRRMNSALVRKDPVMVHDPLRTHSRATMVGVILSAIGLLGFLIFGIIKPKAQAPSEGIVIGKDSGQIFVKVKPKQVPDPQDPSKKINDPSTLIPTYNLASARLMLMNPADMSKPPSQIQAVQPTVVPDDRLEGIKVGPDQGIPDANTLLPTKDQRISDSWSVCNSLPLDKSLPEAEQLKQAEDVKNQKTAILAGTSSVGEQLKELPPNQAVLVKVGGTFYLIYRPQENANHRSDVVRAEVKFDDIPTKNALKFNEDKNVRDTAPALVESIQNVGTFAAPDVPGAGTQTNWSINGQRQKVGDVFQQQRAGGDYAYYLVLPHGKQEISQAVAILLRYKNGGGDVRIPTATPDEVQAVDDAPKSSWIDTAKYPSQIPTLLDPHAYPTMCFDWRMEGANPRTRIYVGQDTQIPYPKQPDRQNACGRDNDQVCPINVTQPNENGFQINEFYMPQHRAAVVHMSTGEGSLYSGPIELISDRGVRYGVPTPATAAALGLWVGDDKSIRPAPQLIAGLLPKGASLNPQNAQKVNAASTAANTQAGQPLPQAGG